MYKMGRIEMNEPTQGQREEFKREVDNINKALELSREPVQRLSMACNLSIADIEAVCFPSGMDGVASA